MSSGTECFYSRLSSPVRGVFCPSWQLQKATNFSSKILRRHTTKCKSQETGDLQVAGPGSTAMGKRQEVAP
jgi:hypothetical protein